MNQPKYSKGTEVSVTINDKERQDKVLNVFPVQFSPEGRPIIKPIDKIEYSYMLEGYRSLRFNEDELKEITKSTTKK
jgi:hypothetical protein